MVIQRWQSVFLLIVTAMMACFTFFSLGQVQMPDFSLEFTTMGFSIEGRQPVEDQQVIICTHGHSLPSHFFALCSRLSQFLCIATCACRRLYA